jgi:nicotinamidase-related amidase
MREAACFLDEKRVWYESWQETRSLRPVATERRGKRTLQEPEQHCWECVSVLLCTRTNAHLLVRERILSLMGPDTALVVIDVQAGLFAEPEPVFQGADLLLHINHLLAKARSAGVPVVYLQHWSKREDSPRQHGTRAWQIHPAVAPQPGEVVIEKRTPDAFAETTLHQELQTHGIKKLIMTGIQTECCVDTTCRRACSLGYDVTLVKDGHSTWNTDLLTASQIIAHHNALLEKWFVTLKEEASITFGEPSRPTH